MRARGHVVAYACAVLVLAGCTAPAEQVPPTTFTERSPLPTCGSIELGQGESVDDDAWHCLDESTSRDGAELVVTAPSTEGDPILTYYRVGPGIDGLELFVDATQDRFGVRGWSHQLCPDTATTAAPRGCVEV